jgi:membrane protein YqaA with SNARE-associated domain
MLRRLYDWTMALSARKSASVWLAVIAFVESSFFLVPADVLFLPMALARPERAWRYAAIASKAKYPIHQPAMPPSTENVVAIAAPVLEFWGKLDTFNELKSGITYETALLMLVTSGFAHLPPIKVVTILSGAVHINIWLFIAAAVVTRGARFFLLAWLLRRNGESIRHFIEKRLGKMALIGAVLLIAVYCAYKMLMS